MCLGVYSVYCIFCVWVPHLYQPVLKRLPYNNNNNNNNINNDKIIIDKLIAHACYQQFCHAYPLELNINALT